MLRQASVVRWLLAAAVIVVNLAVPSVQAEPTECWDCKWCSGGVACCPEGTKYLVCLQNPENNQQCLVYKGSCAGPEGEEEEESIDPDGDPIPD
jgi:hypothetical protein